MLKKIDTAIKAKVALEALKGEQTIAEIAVKYHVHPNKHGKWLEARANGECGRHI